MIYSNKIENELQQRWRSIQSEMKNMGADAFLLSSNVNLFYVTDRVYSGYFYLPAEGKPIFFVKRPINLVGEQVIYIRKPEQIAEILVSQGYKLPQTLMIETDELSYNDVVRLQSIFKPEKTLNATTTIRKVRSIKSDYEIGLLSYSSHLQVDCYKVIPSLFEKEMTDLDLSIEIERIFRKNGSLGHFRIFGQSMEIFMGSVLAGENAEALSPYDFAMGGSGTHASLPIGCNGAKLKEGMPVMIDMGGTFTGYITDMTRVYSIGKLPQKAYDTHQVSLEIQNEISLAAKPGTPTADLYQIALSIVEKNRLTDYFMGYKQQAGFVGHGVGIEINESPVIAPRSKDILVKGNVFALEPKFVLPGIGAVGIENTFVVTDNGLQKLTIFDEEIIQLA